MSNLSELIPSGGGQNQVEFVASGTLPNGKPVILNSNGTVTVVGGEGVTSIPAGSEYVFSAASTQYISVAFDPNTANKFVAAYLNGPSATGRAIVGTVSGTSISFGTEVVFHSADTADTSVFFDPNTAGKFVICYRQAANNGSGTAIVGTVSGTTLSFGTAVVFNTRVYYPTGAFDQNTAGKFVVGYRDRNDSNNGNSRVGTVSGTSISFGTEVTFNSGESNVISIESDPNTAGKFIITYADAGNSSYATAIIGTVSGTSVSYGSEAVFNSTSSSNIAVAFDPNTANKLVTVYQNSSSVCKSTIGTVSGTSISFGTAVTFNSAASGYARLSFDPNTAGVFVVAYQDGGNSNYGTAIIGTVSGTSISFSSEHVFNAGGIEEVGLSFDPNTTGKFTVAYMDQGNSSKGTAIVGTAGTTNLTSTNLIGIAAGAASSGATAKINTWGGINESQTSLTIGTDYYAQTNGTITTATGGQKLGTAISATTINMRDLP